MKSKYIKHFRFIRAMLFTLRILSLYLIAFFIRHFIPHFLYSKLLKRLNRFSSKRIRNYFFKLQGIYIKVGQFLSVVGNIFAPELARYLKDLQDRVPPRPFEVFHSSFQDYWDCEPAEMLDTFNPTPIASASLGQVYEGYYRGKKVAVKLLYPHIKDIIEKDLQILRSVLNILRFFFPTLETEVLYNEFADMILKEIDLNYEKSNIRRLRNLFIEEEIVFIPDFVPELSKGNILVTEFVEGCKIDDTEGIAAMGKDPSVIAHTLLDIYSRMIFEYGFFHSDPHPGNLILTPEGKIGIIDFGSADTIPQQTILDLRKLLKAFLFKDIALFVQQLEDMGFLKPSSDKEEVENIVYFITQKLNTFEIKDYQRMTLNEIYRIYNIRILGVKIQELMRSLQLPRNYLFLFRTIGILVGVVGKLDPQINILQILIPHFRKFLLERKTNLKKVIREEVKTNLHYLSQLPENVHNMLETVNSGRLKINLKEMKKDVQKLYILGHQFIYTLLLITMASFSLIFHLTNKQSLSKLFGIGSLFFAFFLLVSFIRNRKT
jgi:predicted unusual protein kinase regulating ubiquinone biosynthesis (AarF/ABC1/UbiB family)